MKIKATTHLGVYFSSELNCIDGDDDRLRLEDLIEDVCERGEYFSMETDTGKLFLPKAMIQQSVFELVY